MKQTGFRCHSGHLVLPWHTVFCCIRLCSTCQVVYLRVIELADEIRNCLLRTRSLPQCVSGELGEVRVGSSVR